MIMSRGNRYTKMNSIQNTYGTYTVNNGIADTQSLSSLDDHLKASIKDMNTKKTRNHNILCGSGVNSVTINSPPNI